mmetsp:Transcript_24508/g.69866  ORF Transcript_24508/g.69866 Transcript_24508/m.69866 type:complete len:89 (+) Transcript_24508:807-1073(+)
MLRDIVLYKRTQPLVLNLQLRNLLLERLKHKLFSNTAPLRMFPVPLAALSDRVVRHANSRCTGPHSESRSTRSCGVLSCGWSHPSRSS